MTALFPKGPDLDVRGRSGRDWLLLDAKEIIVQNPDGSLTRYLMPAGATSDGATIPQFLWSLGLAPFGDYWPAAFAHDCAFRGTLMVWKDNAWAAMQLTEEEANELINALMIALCVDTKVRLAIYYALKMFGRKAFLEDQQAIKNSHLIVGQLAAAA